MAALTDGTQAGTIQASPITPAPVTADTSTTSSTPDPTTTSTPVSTISSKTAADYTTNTIQPTLNTATNDITTNNTKLATTLPPDDPSNKYNTATGQLNPKYVDPNTTKTTTDTNNANPGYKFAYDPVTGTQTQIPTEDDPATYGLSATNPTLGPTTAVTSQVNDTTGNTYKQFADGTYGRFDASGKYVGTASSQDYQNAQDATGLLSSLHQLANGSYPLTADQQAQVAGLQGVYAQLIQEQKVANENLTGGTTVAMNLYGMGNSIAGLGIIKGTVDSGLAKIADLNNKLVAAVAQMKSGFQKDNYDMVKGAYDEYAQAAKDKQAQLDKITADAAAAQAVIQDRKDKLRQYNLDVAKYQQTQDQNAFDNALKTEQEAFDEKYKTKDLAIKAFQAGYGVDTNNPAGITGSASMGASGAPDPTSQKQVLDQITAKYGPMTATAIKGLANYEINPTDWSTRAAKGMTREQAVTLAKMYDPTYNDAMFSVRQGYMKNLASTGQGTIGGAINSANKSINHLSAFVNSMATLSNAPSATGNAIFNPIENIFNPARRQATGAAKTEGMGVADELAKFFKGTGATDVQSIEDWKSQLSTNASPADVKGLTQGAITLLAGQLETLSEQYTQTMGKAPPGGFLGASAMANLSQLKNEGYQVDIPGVLYTDKDAYVKNDPDATANMQAATQQLQAAGLPLTPDNILQLAQNQ